MEQTSKGVAASLPNQKRQAARKYKSAATQKLQKRVAAILLILPLLLLLTAFVYYPFVKTIISSFYLMNFKGERVSFSGLDTYAALFASPEFYNSLLVTLVFVPLVVVPSLLFATVLAALCRVKTKGVAVFDILFSLPVAIASSCVTIVFMTLLDPNMGLINSMLHLNILWYQDASTALISVAMVVAWCITGLNFLFLVSAVRAVPQSYYESVSLDGRDGVSVFFKITLPCISPTLFFLLVMDTLMAFQSFGPINIMTRGGPSGATDLFSYSIYKDAFFNFRYSEAAVKSVLFFLILLGITIAQMRLEKRKVFYQ